MRSDPGTTAPQAEPIAIIGLSCKFAGDARNAESLWQLLAEKKSAWTEIPISRFNAKGHYHPNAEKLNTMNVRGGHFIDEDIGLFDASFFNLSTEMAAAMDPQFRFQLESVYEALENAGIPLEQVAGSRTSVYAGLWVQDYKDNLTRDEDNMPRFYATGTGSAFAANRISHFFDLRGGSMTIDTGCSTTLVALHQAVLSLRQKESDMAIVGGSNLILNPDTFKTMSSAGFLSADGKSYAFDERANGYGRGDGVATIVIKRLGDALTAGDPIRAVIRETGINQDGRTESITSPSQAAQIELMRECYTKAELDPRDTQYFEAHGTGTATGDPIEAGAVAAVFQDGRSVDQALRIGSIKTNIGHTEVTSGLASIIKVVLSMEKGMIPASINFEKGNRKIPMSDLRLKLVRDMEEWPTGPVGIKRASINNFGYGGTNAHVIMESRDYWKNEDELSQSPSESAQTSGVLILTAKKETACQDMVANLKQYLQSHSKTSDAETLPQDVLYTLGQRRSNFSWVAAHRIPLNSGLEEVANALSPPQFKPVRASRTPRIGMIFTGQGAQWHAMGRELISAYPVFKASLDEADTYLSQMGAYWSLMEELNKDVKLSRVNDTALSIPICVALQISLVRLLWSWGITPAAVTSHSSGEISAAYVVGALDYKSAMAVAYYRAVLTTAENLHRTTRGGMVAVGIGIDETEEYLAKVTSGQAVAACINSPSSVTVAGDVSAVEEVEKMMKADSIFARRLRVDAAYHSHHMEPVAEPYREALRNAKLEGETKGDLESIIYSSPVTGRRVLSAKELAEPEHWVDSMVQPVRFVESFTDMVLGDFHPSGTSVDVLIEVGPHTALGGGMKDIMNLPEFSGLQLPYYGCLVRNTDARNSMQDLAANLLREGHPVDLAAVNFPRGKPAHVHVLTDLPSYPWSHQTKHWQESRVNRAIRERSQPHHDLLGSIASWANPASPSWRHILRADDNSWLRDHIVQSSIVYPGAGFICLAIEAVAQMAALGGEERPISGFSLRDVDIQLALIVPDNIDGVEVQTILTPTSNKAVGTQNWKNFEVVSVTAEGKWTQHARGIINVEFDSVNATKPKAANNKLTGYTRRFDPADFYASLRTLSLKHGPKFQGMRSITQSSQTQTSVAIFAVADTNSADPMQTECVIHPTTMDNVVQAAYTALPGAGSQLDSAKVPRSIGKLWVSNKIPKAAGHLFEAWSTLRHADAQTILADISVIDNNENGTSSVLEMENIVFQSLGRSAAPDQDSKPWEKEICNEVKWLPDMSLATPTYLGLVKQQLSHALDPSETQIIQDLRRVCIYYIHDAVTSLSLSEIQQLDGHHGKYYTWLKAQLDLAASGKLGSDSANWTLDDACERTKHIEAAKKASTNGEMVCQLGPHLAAMLRGTQPPLELMMQNRLLYKYYSHMLKCSRSFEQAATLLKQVVHKNPRVRILEIGAGTGGETRYALPALGTAATGGPLASLYHFTDVSAAFFEAAAEEFAEWSDLLQFDQLDIERDPASQGFELGSYDIVIACQVLHATKSMANTMANVRKLMKPNGTLLLVETTKDQVDVQFVFGLLPGWWLSEEKERHSSPSLSIPFWDTILKGAGFTGIDLEVHDCESEEMYSISTIMSASAPAQEPELPSAESFVLVTSDRAPPPQAWLDSLRTSLAAGNPEGSQPQVEILESAASSVYSGKICIFFGEAGDQPLLYSLDAARLEAVKAMTMACKGLLWITRGGASACEKPEFALAAGFLRSLRNEYVGRQFLTLDLDPTVPAWSDRSVPAIVQVLQNSFDNLASSILGDASPGEFEYAERGGVILVPRIYKEIARNKAIFPEEFDYSDPESFSSEPFQQPSRPLRLKAGIPGLLDTLVFDDDDRPCVQDKAIHEDMIEVIPHAYGVNFRDVMVAMGQLEERIMGVECSGRVTKVGKRAAAQNFAVGDAVMCLLRGPVASRVCVEWTNVVRMPAALSFTEAASIPVVFTTAYYSLYEVARLKPGHSVLIHAAAGGVGQAAIMLSQHLGATIFATVGSPEKKTLLIEKYGIPAEHIFSSRDVSFAERVLAATNRRGVDVVLNSLSGPLLQASFNIVAPFGHFVEIGKSDIERNSSLEMRPFARHVSFSSVDWLAMMRLRPHDVRNVLVEVARLATDKVVRPVQPLTVYPICDVAKAFRLLQTGQHSGKVVLEIRPEDRVPVLPYRRQVRLSPDASYLLVGGVGGIGRSVANWMVEHGAKYLILLSRSAGDKEKTGSFVEQLSQAGCHVKAISCDVADPHQLERALSTCEKEKFPPVRGIIQGAMVLKDSILEQMSIDSYTAAVRPKVAGTWNLHSRFSRADDLDFFILLSSNVGILGNASQANYAAGGTYEDALARWRLARGLPCVSIDLAAVKSVGFVAETTGVWTRMAKLGHMALDEDVVRNVLESAILAPGSGQIVAGINGGPGQHWDREGSSQLGRDARFTALRYRQQQQQQYGSKKSGDDDSLAHLLAEASSRNEVNRLVGHAIAQKLADIFSISVEDIDMAKAPRIYGVDSLVSVELKNMLTRKVGSEVSSFEIMQSGSLDDLARDVAAKSSHVSAELK